MKRMEKVNHYLQLIDSQSKLVSQFPVNRPGFYEALALRGIRADRVEPGRVSCTFKVSPRLTDRTGKLASGAIANLVEEVGGALVHTEGLPMNVSVDMSITFLSDAKARVLGKKGIFWNWCSCQEQIHLIAEGGHSLFGKHNNKI